MVRILTLIPIYASIYFLLHLFWHSHGEKPQLVRTIIGALMQGAVFACVFSFYPRHRQIKYTVSFDDEEIITDIFGVIRKVQRGKIKSILQRNRGLLLSNHSRLSTFFRGGVWIPKALPEYEEIKNLVASWQKQHS